MILSQEGPAQDRGRDTVRRAGCAPATGEVVAADRMSKFVQGIKPETTRWIVSGAEAHGAKTKKFCQTSQLWKN